MSQPDTVEQEPTPVADDAPTYADLVAAINSLGTQIVAAINSLGTQMNWLCDSHAQILSAVSEIRQGMTTMGPMGFIKSMMGGQKNGG